MKDAQKLFYHTNRHLETERDRKQKKDETCREQKENFAMLFSIKLISYKVLEEKIGEVMQILIVTIIIIVTLKLLSCFHYAI